MDRICSVPFERRIANPLLRDVPEDDEEDEQEKKDDDDNEEDDEQEGEGYSE